MADNVSKERENENELEDEIDLGALDDFSLDTSADGKSTEEGGKRKPDKPIKNFMMGALKGAGDAVSYVTKQTIATELPATTSVVEDAKNTYQEFTDLKDELSGQIAPMLLSLENASRKLLPKAKNYIPKKMYEKMQKKLDERHKAREDARVRLPSKEEMESSLIADELAAIFESQLETEQTNALASKQAELTQLAIGGARHKEQSAWLRHIYEASHGTELFHRSTFTAYLKKSLELKYKHLFVARDTFNLLDNTSKHLEGYLKSLVHNTMLPDMVKIQMGDYHKKNRTERYGMKMDEFLSSARKKIFDKVKSKAKDMISNAGFIVDQLENAADQIEMSDSLAADLGMDQDKKTGKKAPGIAGRILGTVAGGLASIGWAQPIADKLRPFTRDFDGAVQDTKANAMVNLAQIRKQWAEQSDSRIKNFLAEFLPDLERTTQATNDLLDKPNDTAAFDNLTRQSIVEIIPGYLGKILHSMDKLRTGDDDVEEQVYNIYSRRFTGIGTLKEDAAEFMFGDESSRKSAIMESVASLKAGMTRNSPDENNSDRFKGFAKDINRFMLNHAVYVEFFDPEGIRNYLLSKGEYTSSYITNVTKGFEHDPREVLKLIYDSIFDKNGDLDKRVVSDINKSITNVRKLDNYKSEFPKLVDFGYRGIFADKINTRQKAALEKKASEGDKEAAKTLKKMTGLVSDTGALNLSNLVERSADFDYEGVEDGEDAAGKYKRYNEKYTQSDSDRRHMAQTADKLKLDKMAAFGTRMAAKTVSGYTKIKEKFIPEWQRDWDEGLEELRNKSARLAAKADEFEQGFSAMFSSGLKEINKTIEDAVSGGVAVNVGTPTTADETTTNFASVPTRKFKLPTPTPVVPPTPTPDEPVVTPVVTSPAMAPMGTSAATQAIFDSAPIDSFKSTFEERFDAHQEFLREWKKDQSEERGLIVDQMAEWKQFHIDSANTIFEAIWEVGKGLGAGDGPSGGDKKKKSGLMGRIGLGLKSGAMKLGKFYKDTYAAALTGLGSAVGGIGHGIGRGFDFLKDRMSAMKGAGLIDKIGGGLKNIGKGYVELYGKTIDAIGGIGKTVAKGLFGSKAPKYVDVYAAGETDKDPLLTKRQQEEGVFIKATGKRLESSAGITSAIVDKDHNVLISNEQIKKGLVDKDGKALSELSVSTGGLLGGIKPMLSGLGKFAKDIGTRGFGMYADIYQKLFSLGIDGVRGAGKFISNLFTGGGGKELKGFDGKRHMDLLSQIASDVALLAADKKPMAGDEDGDGDIDGSYADQMQKKGKQEGVTLNALALHKDVDWREKNGGSGEGGDGKNSPTSKLLNGLWGKFANSAFAKGILTKVGALGTIISGGLKSGFGKLGGWLKPMFGKMAGAVQGLGGKLGGLFNGFGGKAGKLFSKIPGVGKLGGLGSKIGGLASKLPGIGKLGGIVSKVPGVGGLVAKLGPMMGALGPVAGYAAAAAGAGYLAYKGLGLGGIIKGIRGNDNPLTEKEVEQGRSKLQRQIDKGRPGYDRILQEYEKAIAAQNWRRARELSGQEADGIIASMWKESWIGKGVRGIGNFLFGNKSKEMSEAEIKKVYAKYESIMKRGGSAGKNAERTLERFKDYVAEGNWDKARELAGMEERGIFGKFFQDSKGNFRWNRLLGPIGMIFDSADENAPMSEKEVKSHVDRLTVLKAKGNAAAGKLLDKFNEAVTEMNWKKARQLVGAEAKSGLEKTWSAMKTTAKWTTRIGTLGLSMLFETSDKEAMTETEVTNFQKKMEYLIKKGDKRAERKLEKFNEAVAKQNWEMARGIAKMPHQMAITRAAKATWGWLFGNDENPMTDAEIKKFRDSMERKIKLGNRAAQKKLDAFEDAVGRQNWERARRIAGAPDDGVITKGLKSTWNGIKSGFRAIFGGDGEPMSESELTRARKILNNAVEDKKPQAQRRLDKFEDYVADEKWEKARALVKMPYDNAISRGYKAVKGWLLGGDNLEPMSPEEIEKFRKECEWRIQDGNKKAQKLLDRFEDAVANERWDKARQISNTKNEGVWGSMKSGAKSVWKWITGSKDRGDAEEMREKIENKIAEEGDDTGMYSAGLEEFSNLVRRRKFKDAIELGEDILNSKPHELKAKHKFNSKKYDELAKQAQELVDVIQKEEDENNGWAHPVKEMQIAGLRKKVMSSSDQWGEDFFDDTRDELAEIVGKPELYSKNSKPSDEDIVAGKELISTIDKLYDDRSWIGSPVIKMKLNNLKSEIKSRVSDWDAETIRDWQERLAEIDENYKLPPNTSESSSKDEDDDDVVEELRKRLVQDISDVSDKYSWWASPKVKSKLAWQSMRARFSNPDDPEATYKQWYQDLKEADVDDEFEKMGKSDSVDIEVERTRKWLWKEHDRLNEGVRKILSNPKSDAKTRNEAEAIGGSISAWWDSWNRNDLVNEDRKNEIVNSCKELSQKIRSIDPSFAAGDDSGEEWVDPDNAAAAEADEGFDNLVDADRELAEKFKLAHASGNPESHEITGDGYKEAKWTEDAATGLRSRRYIDDYGKHEELDYTKVFEQNKDLEYQANKQVKIKEGLLNQKLQGIEQARRQELLTATTFEKQDAINEKYDKQVDAARDKFEADEADLRANLAEKFVQKKQGEVMSRDAHEMALHEEGIDEEAYKKNKATIKRLNDKSFTGRFTGDKLTKEEEKQLEEARKQNARIDKSAEKNLTDLEQNKAKWESTYQDLRSNDAKAGRVVGPSNLGASAKRSLEFSHLKNSKGKPIADDLIEFYGDRLKSEPWLRDVTFPGDPADEKNCKILYDRTEHEEERTYRAASDHSWGSLQKWMDDNIPEPDDDAEDDTITVEMAKQKRDELKKQLHQAHKELTESRFLGIGGPSKSKLKECNVLTSQIAALTKFIDGKSSADEVRSVFDNLSIFGKKTGSTKSILDGENQGEGSESENPGQKSPTASGAPMGWYLDSVAQVSPTAAETMRASILAPQPKPQEDAEEVSNSWWMRSRAPEPPKVPEQLGPTKEALAQLESQNNLIKQLEAQNAQMAKLVDSLTGVTGKDGLRISGMGTLIDVTANQPAPVVNSTTVIQASNNESGIDLRKRQN